MEIKIDTIIFDLGGVLIDWNPEKVYLEEFKGDTEKMKWFLNHVCTSEWNVEQDAGRTIEEGERLKIAEFPEYEKQIRKYYGRWEEMCVGTFEGTLAIFEAIKKSKKYHYYALTNFSNETWPAANRLYPFIQTFEGIVMSGDEKTIKPFDPIYQLIINRYNINPSAAVFIDDKLENIVGARKNGMHGIHFQNPKQLAEELKKLGVTY
jgi:2-haloacid dehalogenase